MSETVIMAKSDIQKTEFDSILSDVIKALKAKGYNPVTQLAGYLYTGDPIYITSYNNARVLIQRVDRCDLVEYIASKLVKDYGE